MVLNGNVLVVYRDFFPLKGGWQGKERHHPPSYTHPVHQHGKPEIPSTFLRCWFIHTHIISMYGKRIKHENTLQQFVCPALSVVYPNFCCLLFGFPSDRHPVPPVALLILRGEAGDHDQPRRK